MLTINNRSSFCIKVFVLFCLNILPARTVIANPSFDCNKAQTKIEKALCDFSWLGEKDSEMASSYRKAVSSDDKAYTKWVKNEQRAWIKRRNKECGTLEVLDEEERWMKGDLTTCLSAIYDERIKYLDARPDRHGDWDIYTGKGIAFAKSTKDDRILEIFNDEESSGVAYTGATTESKSYSSIENIYLPYVTYKTSTTARFGAYYNYYYKFSVFDLESGSRVSLQNIFPENEVLEQVQATCDRFKCNKTGKNLNELLDTLRYSCNESTSAVIDNDILKQFFLRDIDAQRIEVKIVFHNPCRKTAQEGFEPIEWMLEFKKM